MKHSRSWSRSWSWLVSVFFIGGLALADTAPAPSAAPADPKPQTSAAPSAAATSLSPEGQKVWAYLGELFEASKLVNDAKGKAASRAKIETALDWDRVAQDCLGKANWAKQSAGNRAKFRNLLKEVILKTAFSRMDKFWNKTTYSLASMEQKGNEATAAASFQVEGGEPLTLIYYMNKKGAKWTIYDISYDDIRYSTNINEQIEEYLRNSNFNSLLDKLKKRSAEIK